MRRWRESWRRVRVCLSPFGATGLRGGRQKSALVVWRLCQRILRSCLGKGLHDLLMPLLVLVLVVLLLLLLLLLLVLLLLLLL